MTSVQTETMTSNDIHALACQIATAANGNFQSNLQARSWIRTIHRLPDGAEALRLIVRDDLEGMGSMIADSLWFEQTVSELSTI